MSEKQTAGSIFIIRSPEKSLDIKAAEAFLMNRNWTVASSSNLKEALDHIINMRPEIIMVLAEHPNAKTRSLPKIISHTKLPMTAIAYTENKGSSIIGAMHEMACKYTLYPPISGPAIERMILKIRKDESESQKARDTSGLDSVEANFIQAQSLLSSLIFTGTDKQGPGVFVSKGEKLGDYSGYMPDHTAEMRPSLRDLDKNSIFVRGAQQALDESVIVRGEESSVESIGSVTNAACIIIDSPRFKGYLVAALGQNRKIDSEFISTIKQRLISFLKSHGETIDESKEPFEINIKQVPFEDWALEQAEFLRTSIHNGNEVALAFFPTPDTKLTLEESTTKDMLKLDLAELKEDTPVSFDLYIHMPENNKYLLYTPQGQPIYKTQKSRLEQKGITHLHLKKDSAPEVKKYRVQNFLNDKIEAYKKSLKNK